MSRQDTEAERKWIEQLPIRQWLGWHAPRADDLIPTPPINLDEAIPYEKE